MILWAINVKAFKGIILAKLAKMIFADLFGRWWFGSRPSSIYNSIRTITSVLVLFFWVKTSTHYQGAVLST